MTLTFLLGIGTVLMPPAMGATKAQWIAPLDSHLISIRTPCPILRSPFIINGRPIGGHVRVIGLGHYALHLNGARVGESLIDQPWSQYNKTIFRQEFEIGGLLREGENVWGVLLGNSFWRVTEANDSLRFVKTDAMPDFSAGQPYLLWLEADIRMADGRTLVVGTDTTWRWHDGPLTFSHIYAGEDFDARLMPAGWDSPGFNDRLWSGVRAARPPDANIEEYTAPPIEAFETFSPVKIESPAQDEFTYIFPQNCSALLRFTVEGKAGKRIRFKPCEYVDSTGRVKFTYTWGTGKDIWHDYTPRGSGPESHQILFCYVGCQYVGVTGAVPEGYPNPGNLPVIRNLELVHVRAACPEAGFFSSSSDIQNGAYHLIDWSMRSNMSYVATDCPHREKNGWQEQNWHMARALSYRFNIQSWFRKIAHDLRDTQLPDGHIPTNCPNYLVGIPPHGYWNEAPEWGISGVLVPWHLYEWYGDTATLRLSFNSMRRYVDYLTSQAKDGVITSNLGDWYDYGHGKGDGPSQWTPNEVSATAIWALGATTVARTAEILGLPEEGAKYRLLFDQIKRTFQNKFYDPVTKTVTNNGSCQAGHSAALCIGLIPEDDRGTVLQGVIDDLERRNWQQTVGEVMQVFFVRALAEAGRSDILHRVYNRDTRGSYGYMVRQGFTTLPESWDARPGTPNSMNHFMLGHLMEWQFAYLAGVRQKPGSVGWRQVVIQPNPGPLDSASATFLSPAGRIAVNWQKEDGKYTLQVDLAEGITAEAILPNGERHELAPGRTELEWQ